MKMQVYTLLFGVLLFVATVNCRHYKEQDETEQNEDERADLADNARRLRKHNGGLMRHRRRAWQNNMNQYPGYGYDYSMPQNPFYPDYRNDQNNQELLPQIYRLLDEISAYVKRPQIPPPPQPIYVPYAVPYPVQAQCKCKDKDAKPDIGNRFGVMEDDNQNWGLVPDAATEEENDGTRPISFVPIMPAQKPKRKQVNVEHGSSQAGVASVQIPAIPAAFGQEGRVPSQSAAKVPGMCEVFSLSCCNGSPQQQKQCFINVGCSSTYEEGRGCNKDRLLTIIDAYSKAYSPVN